MAPNKPPRQRPETLRRILIEGVMIPLVGMTAAGFAVFALVNHFGGDGETGNPRATYGVQVGQSSYIGRSNCDKAIRQVLSDPDSFERRGTQIIDVKEGEGWVAETRFSARNAYGGRIRGTAHCLFDGSSYRALLVE